MDNSGVTYGQLDRLLSELGFSMEKAKPHWRRYEHTNSNTVIIFADEEPSEPALPSDIVSARLHLIHKGLITEQELEAKLHRNGN